MKKSLFVYNEGTLQRHDNTIRFIDTAGNKKDIPIETVGEINIMTQMEFNTSFLNILSQNGIMVHCYNYYDYYIGSFYPKESIISGELLVNQVNHYTDSDKRLKIAQKFIDGAADNIYRNVRYYNARGKDLQSTLDDIDNIRKNIYKSKSVTELMGYEGNIRKIYYKSWNTIVNQNINFEKRVKNPPDNMINTLISFVNTMIYTRVLSEIYKNDNELETIDNAIYILEAYVKIMEVRFGNKVEFFCVNSDELGEYLIPRFCLQPLVENSFIHGMSHTENGLIVLRGEQNGNDVELTLIDNGEGLHGKELDLSKESEDNKRGITGIGLSNIHKRIQTLYGPDYGLNIDTTVEIGFKISLRIPAMKREAKADESADSRR